eukprot:TRINITY_DN10495_c0_g1_i2.p2 TRINITY_DN10495_c0_g1~~TRINITY_DN10495_c0_g1_i2.p2  ORF type:complete len:119 (-),score=31.80 TRINITY_DN10495_c0_g1_i2:44-370(-)
MSAGKGKGKKKKWSKGKVREKLNNLVGFDADTLKKFQKEVPTYKLITPSAVSDRMKITGSLARAALKQLHADGQITLVSQHSSQLIYTRSATATIEEPTEAPTKKGGK